MLFSHANSNIFFHMHFLSFITWQKSFFSIYLYENKKQKRKNRLSNLLTEELYENPSTEQVNVKAFFFDGHETQFTLHWPPQTENPSTYVYVCKNEQQKNDEPTLNVKNGSSFFGLVSTHNRRILQISFAIRFSHSMIMYIRTWLQHTGRRGHPIISFCFIRNKARKSKKEKFIKQ